MNSITGAYPQSTPVFALFYHLPDAVDDIEDPEARLKSVNRFVQVCGSLLALQERAFLVDETMSSLRDARVERGDLVAENRRMGLDGEQGRNGRNKVSVVLPAYPLDLSVL